MQTPPSRLHRLPGVRTGTAMAPHLRPRHSVQRQCLGNHVNVHAPSSASTYVPSRLPQARRHPISPTSSFTRWRLTRIAEARFFMHVSTFLHFRCAITRSRAQFSAYRDVNGVRGRAGAYMDLDETMIHTSFVPPLHPSRARFASLLFLLATLPLHHPLRASLRNPGPRRPSFLASPPVPLRTPTRAVLLSGRPAFHHFYPTPPLPVTTIRDRDAHQALSHRISIAMLRTKARLKPKRSTTKTSTRAILTRSTRCTGVPSGLCALAPLLLLHAPLALNFISRGALRISQGDTDVAADAVSRGFEVDFGDLTGILILLREWHFGYLAFSRDIHSRFRGFSFFHPHPFTLYLRAFPRPCPSFAGWTSHE
ncbi:hypothetical protein DFH08DRAFT_1035609 [Mycena albidolilacea]|uniref:Uncharacterized protein n=1 Tax=Mycena albidolilacea TaxID=1033008 RepID=A0AAD7EF65_9AGAR|nr:hypothetical protein DFH08DRAFT_1035609 [Mycena albidolilacea]